ncbi:MAG: ROK family protein [Nitrospinota bacterium]
MKYVIGVDLGGTNIRGAAISLGGEVLYREKKRTEVSKGRDYVVQNLEELLLSIEKSMGGARAEAAGVGVPGIVHFQTGVVEKSPNFPDWVQFNLKKSLEERGFLRVVVENDANAAALGEGWKGAGEKEKSFCVFTLGTGIGGGIVLDGEIWRGSLGMAGEIGHINIYPDGRTCGCGSRGCMEQYASASGIVKEANSGIDSPEATALKLALSQEKEGRLSASFLYLRAREGDDYAAGVLRKAGKALGIGITDLINILNIELFIIGGGASEAWDQFIGPLKEEIKARAYQYTGDRVQIKKALLGDDAGLMGAAFLALSARKASLPQARQL